MSAGGEGATEGRARLRRAGVRLLYGLLAAAAIYVLLRNLDSPNDFRHFRDFGLATLAGQFPYDPAVEARWYPGTWATWPPSFLPVALLLARLDAALGQAAAIALWQLANLASLAVVLTAGIRWMYGRRLSLAPLPGRASTAGAGDGASAPGRGSSPGARSGSSSPGADRLPLWTLAAMVGILVPARLLLSNFEHTQANLLMLGLAVAAFVLFREDRRALGGLAFGLSSALKATPLLLLAYLAWRGRWKDIGAAVGGCAVTWGLLPALAVGPGQVTTWYAAWWERTGALHLPTSGMNQSLQATFTRLLAPEGPLVAQGPGAGGLGGYGAEVWVLAAVAVLGLAAAVAFGRPFRRVTARREALELGVVLTAMALFSPIGWKFHFVGLLPLALALYATLPRASGWIRGTEGADGGKLGLLRGASARGVAAALVAAAAAVNLTATDLIGGTAADVMERYGVVTWSALLLVLAALWALWRARDAGPAGSRSAGGQSAGASPPGAAASSPSSSPASA